MLWCFFIHIFTHMKEKRKKKCKDDVFVGFGFEPESIKILCNLKIFTSLTKDHVTLKGKLKVVQVETSTPCWSTGATHFRQ